MQKRAVIVAGMHRSGTSAIARVLNLLGFALPKVLIPPAPDNPLGFWEPLPIVRAHDELLESFGSSWHDISPLPPSALESEIAARFQENLYALLEQEFADEPLFMVKDPRVSRVIPLWTGPLERFGANASFVISARNPLEVAGSLKERDGTDTGTALLLWLRYTLEAERATRGHPRTFVSYEGLLRDWRAAMQKVSEDLSLAWPRSSHEVHLEIEEFLSRQHRHHEFATGELDARADIVAWVKKAYGATLEAVNGSPDASRKTFDFIFRQLTEADLAYGPILAAREIALAKGKRELEASTDEVEKLRAELQALEGTLAERVGEVEARDAALAERRREVEAKTWEAKALRSRLQQREESLAERLSDLAARDTALAARTRELEVSTEETKNFKERLQERDKALAARTAESERLASEVERLAAELSEREHGAGLSREEAEALTTQLAERSEILAAQAQESAALRAELAKRQEALTRASAEIEHLSAEAGNSAHELRRAGQLLSIERAKVDRLVEEVDARDARLVAAVRETASLRQEVEVVRAELSESQDALAAHAASAEELRAQVRRSRGKTGWLTRRVLETEETLAARMRDLKRLDRATVRLRTKLADRDEAHREELERLSAQVAARDAGLAAKGREIQALSGKLGASAAEIDSLLAALKSKTDLLDRHVAEMSAMRDSLQTLRETAERQERELAEQRSTLELFVSLRRRPSRWRSISQFASWFFKRPSRQRLGFARAYFRLKGSGLFDPDFYVSHYSDVAGTGSSPLMHYIEHGAREGRDPSAAFAAARYLEEHPDAASSGMNPLFHAVTVARRERRAARRRAVSQFLSWIFRRPLRGRGLANVHTYLRLRRSGKFDGEEYLALYPDVAQAGLNPLMHYVEHGRREGRDAVTAESHATARTTSSLDWEGFSLSEISAARARLAAKPLSVSVIAPTFSDASALKTSLMAVLAQSYMPLEVIVVDNGSSDDAESMLADSFWHERETGLLQYLRVSQGGVGAARNAGLARARGDLIAHLDSDVVWPEHYLLVMAAAAAEDSTTGENGRVTHSELIPLQQARAQAQTGEEVSDRRPVRRPASVKQEKALRTSLENELVQVERSGGPHVSIVILNRDGEEHLRRCMAGLRRTEYRDFDVIVVDNDSSDGSRAFLDSLTEDFDLTVIRNNTNRTFAEANNDGLAAAGGELVLLLNNDVEAITAGWLGHMVETLLETGAVAVGARLIYPRRPLLDNAGDHEFPDLTLQHRGIHFTRGDGIPLGRNLGTGEDPRSDEAAAVAEVPAVTAACMLVRRDALEAVGLLTTGYAYGTEDVDLCLKLSEQGGRIVYDGQAALWHHEYGTQNKLGAVSKRTNRLKNRQLFLDRWGPRIFRTVLTDRLLGGESPSWSSEPIHVAITLTQDDPAAGWGDWYTAHELGDAFEELGWRVTYLERYRDHWYEIDRTVDVVVALLDSFDLRRIPRDIVSVAWVRNWTDRWLSHPWFDDYDIVLASSRRSKELIEKRSSKVARLLPLATNPARFGGGETRSALECDVVFAGNYWGETRGVVDAIPGLQDSVSVKVFGKGWEAVPELAALHAGRLEYDDLPDAYASAPVVIDDTAGPTKPYGAVNARVFDALAAGALVVSDNPDGILELFDQEFPFWEDAASLKKQVDSLLAHPARRQTLADRYRRVVLENHTYSHRAAQIRDVLVEWSEATRFAVNIGVPEKDAPESWGDYHFARALQRQLERHGRPTRVQLLNDWDQPHAAQSDVVIHLFGLSVLEPRSSQVNVLWVISHPDLVTTEMLEQYDVVFVASKVFAEDLSTRVSVPVIPLPQATDQERFEANGSGPSHDLLFVANSRRSRRPVVDALADTPHDLAIYGRDWTPDLVDASRVQGEHVPNETLASYYASAAIVLNDHWPDMQKHGFISNRLYDVLAAGGFVISDEVEGIEDEFEGAVVTYTNREDLLGKVEHFLADAEARRAHAEHGRAVVLRRHTFAHRVGTILDAVDPLLADKAIHVVQGMALANR